MECKYFKCEFWDGHFPCYSTMQIPDPILKDDECEQLIIGVLSGKKRGMTGTIVYFPNTEKLEYEELKKKSLEYIKEFGVHPKNYTRIRSVDREYHICPERRITLYKLKKSVKKKEK